jgi:hypothetical protein
MGSIDLSTLTWEDYLLIGIAGMSIFYLASPDSKAFKPSKKRRKKKSGGSGIFGTLTASAVVLGLAYFGYQYYVGTQG